MLWCADSIVNTKLIITQSLATYFMTLKVSYWSS